MKFSRYPFSPSLQKGLAEAGFQRPTDIQFRAIPPILKGEDVFGIAQTGTGKTAAFAVPILHLLESHPRSAEPGIRCLVLVPTRELALQIRDVFQDLGKYTGIRTEALFGGVGQDPQKDRLKGKVDVLIATPGRLFDLQAQGDLVLTKVRILVLDEADQMLQLGFRKDVEDVLNRIPRRHQTLFFSATLDPHLKELAYSVARNPVRIQIAPKERISKNVTHRLVWVEMDDKRFFLERLVKEHAQDRFLVFVRTKVRAERVAAAMERVQIACRFLHGGLAQAERFAILESFRMGEVPMLVATDVSARGIDIPGVPFVVNYDVPEEPEAYVHRVGRTGRGMEKGTAWTFCATEEKPLVEAIEVYLGKNLEAQAIHPADYEAVRDLSQAQTPNWNKLVESVKRELDLVSGKKTKKPGRKKN